MKQLEILQVQSRSRKVRLEDAISDTIAARQELRDKISYQNAQYMADIVAFNVVEKMIIGVELSYDSIQLSIVIIDYLAYCQSNRRPFDINSILDYLLSQHAKYDKRAIRVSELLVNKRYSCSNSCKLVHILLDFLQIDNSIEIGTLLMRPHCWIRMQSQLLEISGSMDSGTLILVNDMESKGYKLSK